MLNKHVNHTEARLKVMGKSHNVFHSELVGSSTVANKEKESICMRCVINSPILSAIRQTP
jgi:hypothetical protein